MKNILFVINSLAGGGAQRVVTVLANKFIDLGYNVDVFVIENHKEITYSLSNKVKKIFLIDLLNANLTFRQKYYKAKCGILRRLNKVKEKKYVSDRNNHINSIWFERFLADKNYSVIFSFLVESNIIVGLSKNKNKSKIVMAERSFPNRTFFDKEFILLRNRCYNNADILVFQTEEQKKFFPEEIQDKSVVIFNPIKEKLPNPFIGNRKKNVVNFCRLSKPKNLSLLIKACKLVFEKYSDYSLTIYGKGPLKDQLLDEAKTLGIENKVYIYPFDTEIHKKVLDASMFVMTSDYEGMSNSLIEAMGIGLPVIATDCDGGGAKALIENNINGILIPKGDVEACANAIIYYIENPQIAEQYAKEAIKIKEKLSVDNIADKWLKLLN